MVKISWNLVEYLRMNPFGTICRLVDAPSWTIPILWRWLESSWSSFLAVAEHQDSRGSLLRLLRTCVDLLEVWKSWGGLRLCWQPQFGRSTHFVTSCKMILVTVAANKMEQRFVPETSLPMFLKPSRRSPFSSNSRPIYFMLFLSVRAPLPIAGWIHCACESWTSSIISPWSGNTQRGAHAMNSRSQASKGYKGRWCERETSICSRIHSFQNSKSFSNLGVAKSECTMQFILFEA